MNLKVKKYFITFLSLGLILSNFSFATTLMFCSMESYHSSCTCSHNNQPQSSGLSVKSITKSCCDKKTVELSNSNILEILNHNTVNPIISAGFSSAGCNDIWVAANSERNIVTLTHHPPNSEIPILNSSLLI